jgi:hypothetical protein
VGTFIDNHEPKHIANVINSMLQNQTQLAVWKANALNVSTELCWQNEEKVLMNVYASLMNNEE